ncbi:hypothetical protein TYRP_003147 [Tyrophagus putrescentiae]|nr:hypothetical protein TYRP_003147 [Tyrophagus putrescentiae]
MPSFFKRIKNFFTGRRNEPKRTQSPKIEGSGKSGEDEVVNSEVIVAELPPPPTEIVASFEEEELIPSSSSSPTPEAISTVPTTLPPLDDALSRAIYEAVSDTWSRLRSDLQQQLQQEPSSSFTLSSLDFKVIAAIVAVDGRRPQPQSLPTVLTLGTGSQWLHSEHLAMDGGAVQDCHAEIIARRAFLRLLYRQLEAVRSGRAVSSLILEPLHRAGDHDLRHHHHHPNGGYRLKSGLKLYLYISKLPCGSAKLSSCKTVKMASVLRHKSGGKNLLHQYQVGNYVRRKADYVGCGLRSSPFMSCSDKLLLWNVAGLQGALLSGLVAPVYLSGVVLSDGRDSGQAVRRALFTRVDQEKLAAKLGQCFAGRSGDLGSSTSSSSSSSSSSSFSNTTTTTTTTTTNNNNNCCCYAFNQVAIGYHRPDDHMRRLGLTERCDSPGSTVSLNWFRLPGAEGGGSGGGGGGGGGEEELAANVELVNTVTGRPLWRAKTLGVSRLSKRALADQYQALTELRPTDWIPLRMAYQRESPLPPLEAAVGGSGGGGGSCSSLVTERLLSDRLQKTYLELKLRSSPPYLAAKLALRETLAEQGLGSWTQAPAHVDLFTV